MYNNEMKGLLPYGDCKTLLSFSLANFRVRIDQAVDKKEHNS